MRGVSNRSRLEVVGESIDVIDWPNSLACILAWAASKARRYVCCANVHVVMTANSNPSLHQALSNADMVVPDGTPIAWMISRLIKTKQGRIAGPDLMWELCRVASGRGISVYLYGAHERTLVRLEKKLKDHFPLLQVAGRESPPFRPLSRAEEAHSAERINASGAGLVFVGIGCPKQELWMFRQRHMVNAVMLGVGAAFDFHAGVVRRAPRWMRVVGFEWFFRLMQEPTRLLGRYITTNVRFIGLASLQLASHYIHTWFRGMR